MQFTYDDGGRSEAGFTGAAGDCAARAIAIAAQIPYREAYDRLNKLGKQERRGKRKRGVSNARSGVYRGAMKKLMAELGFKWTATMGIGTGCTVHLHDGELPVGRLICSLSKHYCAVIDGVIRDTFDPQREEHWIICENGIDRFHVSRRCVYGYWSAA